MSYEDLFNPHPERGVRGPEGQRTWTPTRLEQLRLSQLRDLARAFEIEIDFDAPKSNILPALAAAEAAGKFKGPPKHELYMLKAMRNPDDPPLEHPEYDPTGTFKRAPSPRITAKLEVFAVMSFKELQQAAKVKGINTFGMTRAEVEHAISGKETEEAE